MGEDHHQEEQHKHVCKFCKKSFPCGRSLGGHMRSHMSNNNNNNNSTTAATDESKLKLSNKIVSSSVTTTTTTNNTNYMVDFEAGGHAGYGLRENPKKTWRLISDSNHSIIDGSNSNSRQAKLCKECGKGFQSWKALFGHMRCHSEKDKERVSNNNSLDDDSWTAQSDNEAAQVPKRRRRSRRRTTTRYNRAATTTTVTTTTVTTSSSFSYANNGSVSVSEIEQEQEEVAMCLMMLSRDVGSWGGLMNSVVESSDNNSVVVEVRSSGLGKNENGDCNGDQSVKMKRIRDKKLESLVSEFGENVRCERKISEFGGSNFGGLRNGFKKFDSEVSVDRLVGEDKIKRPRQDYETGFDVCDAQLGKNMGRNRVKCSEDQADESESDDKCNSSKKVSHSPFDPEVRGESSKKMRLSEALNTEMGKKSRFECTTCSKIFHSYQALGGHRASHKKIKGCFATKIEGSENSIEIETDVSPDPIDDEIKLIKSSGDNSPIESEGAQALALAGSSAEASPVSKKSKHECPICLRVFSSGQALGGHKRSHMVEGAEARANQTIIIQQKLPEIHNLLDLNLPAPIEEENNGHIGLKPWWIGSNPKHEPVAAGLISN